MDNIEQRIFLPLRTAISLLPRVLLGVVLSACCALANDSADLQKRLLIEGPAGWERYQEFSLRLQGHTFSERRDLPENKLVSRLDSVWKQRKGYKLDQIELVQEGRPYSAIVRAENPQYKFDLSRNTQAQPWVVTDLSKKESDDPPASQPPPTGLDFGAPPRLLPYLFRSPEFKVVDISQAKEDGDDLIRISFLCTLKEVPNDPHRKAWLVLDPNHDWVIRHGEADLDFGEEKVKQTFTYEYREGSNHHLIPTSFSLLSSVFKNGKRTVGFEVKSRYEITEEKDVPESEFTLTAFGLPEPPWLKKPSRRPWYLWLALAGIVCLVAGLLVRRYSRRLL